MHLIDNYQPPVRLYIRIKYLLNYEVRKRLRYPNTRRCCGRVAVFRAGSWLAVLWVLPCCTREIRLSIRTLLWRANCV